MASMILYGLLISMMVVGSFGESMSTSCTYVNGVQRCTQQQSQGNVAMSSSQAGYGTGQSYSSNFAGTGNTGTGQSSYSSMSSGNPPPGGVFFGPGGGGVFAGGIAPGGFDPFGFVFGGRR